MCILSANKNIPTYSYNVFCCVWPCRSFKTGCPARIQLYADRTKDALVITDCCVDHNHEPALDAYPEYRRLDESQQTEAKKFLGLGNIVVLDLHYILSGLITLHSYKATNLW